MSEAKLSKRSRKLQRFLGSVALWSVGMCFFVFGGALTAKADPVFDRFIAEVREEDTSMLGGTFFRPANVKGMNKGCYWLFTDKTFKVIA